MKRTQLTAFLMAVGLMTAPLAVAAHAQANERPDRPRQQVTQDETVTTMEAETTEVRTVQANQGQGSANAAARREARRQRFADKLTALREQRIEQRCKVAQVKLTAAAKRAETIRGTREQIYQRLGERLDAFVLRLQNNDLDATVLEDAIDGLMEKQQAFFISYDEYQAALKDASEMDCQADPQAFHAALEDARAQRRGLLAEAKAIRAYVRDEFRKVFGQLRSQLNTQPVDNQTTDEIQADDSQEGGTE